MSTMQCGRCYFCDARGQGLENQNLIIFGYRCEVSPIGAVQGGFTSVHGGHHGGGRFGWFLYVDLHRNSVPGEIVLMT